MNKKLKGFKTAILILSSLVFFETLLLIYLLKAPPKEVKRPVVRVAPLVLKGKIAIVIDDWGYNLNNLELVRQIEQPLTASILPGLSYSDELAEELHRGDVEIILHLPMEPLEKFRLEHNTIMTSMSESTVKKILDQDLSGLPYAVGVSNHMGSKATRDQKTMEFVFQDLKRRRLYFLDSVVHPGSVCADLAVKIGLPFSRRDIFLDNEEESAYIRNQLNKLMEVASKYGQAVGIGHDRKKTLAVLKEAMPRIEKKGYKFVFVSELVR